MTWSASLELSGFAFAWKWESRGKKSLNFLFFPVKYWWHWSCHFLGLFVEDMVTVGTFFHRLNSCTTSTLLTYPRTVSWRGEVKVNTLVLCELYVTKDICALSSISTNSSRLIVVFRMISSLNELQTFRGIWRLAKKKSWNPYTDDQKLLKNLAIIDFESIFVKGDTFYDTDTTPRAGKHISYSVSVPFDLIEEPVFLCKSNPRHLVESFVDALEWLATRSINQMVLKFMDAETSV